MKAIDEYIQKIEKELPDPALTSDLVRAGLYSSVQAAYYARKINRAPSHFEIGHRVFYPKASVIEWLQASKRDGQDFKSQQK